MYNKDSKTTTLVTTIFVRTCTEDHMYVDSKGTEISILTTNQVSYTVVDLTILLHFHQHRKMSGRSLNILYLPHIPKVVTYVSSKNLKTVILHWFHFGVSSELNVTGVKPTSICRILYKWSVHTKETTLYGKVRKRGKKKKLNN